jgi:DNA-binding XRE family transcriptional regulator
MDYQRRETKEPQLICSWCFWSGKSKSRGVVDHAKFFKALGQRVKALRKRWGYSQEDMIAFGFSARHWQQIEAGRPITMRTLLRICDAFKVRIAVVVRGTDKGIYRDSHPFGAS